MVGALLAVYFSRVRALLPANFSFVGALLAALIGMERPTIEKFTADNNLHTTRTAHWTICCTTTGLGNVWDNTYVKL